MSRKSATYIIHKSAITDNDSIFVGNKAVELANYDQNNIGVPDFFVITTQTFDDFLTANNLIGSISDFLESVKIGDYESASAASKGIADLINGSEFPQIIIRPIVQAYSSLSGITEKFVAVKPSWTFEQTYVPDDEYDFAMLEQKGESSVLYSIKNCWKRLFTPEALLLRVNLGYEGAIAMPVIVQRMIQAESNGKASFVDKKTIKIQATLGLTSHLKLGEIEKDSYIFDLELNKVTEKILVAQQLMAVRKGRAKPGEESLLEVPISEDWQRQQKLSDDYIKKVAESFITLQQVSGEYQITIDWVIEAGKVYVLEVEKIAQKEEEKSREIQDDKAAKVLKIKKQDPEIGNIIQEINDTAKELESSIVDSKIEEEKDNILEIDKITNEDWDLTVKRKSKSLTNIFIDTSDLTGGDVTNAKSFDGSYFKANNMIMRHGVLPEYLEKDSKQWDELLEIYTLELTKLEKLIDKKRIFFEFSLLSSKDVIKLAGTPEHDYEFVDRLINTSSIDIEAKAIMISKFNYGVKNISYIIPDARNIEDIINIKKRLSSNNVRRSNISKLFIDVSWQSLVYEMEDLDKRDIDGVVIDLDQLTHNLFGRKISSSNAYNKVMNTVSQISEICLEKEWEFIIKTTADIEILNILEDNYIVPDGLILTTPLLQSFIDQVEILEKSKLNAKKIGRKGRPIKKLY